MALGIGLTTNVYSSKWETLFRDLPGAANAKRLVMLQESAEGDLAPVSYYYVEQYRKQTSLFAGVAAFQTGIPFNVTFPGETSEKEERVFGQLVSADYFAVLGVRAQRGRVFSADLDKPGEAPIVVVSDRFWRNRLHSSPDALGQTLLLNGQLATIVGITPKGFQGALAVNPSELFVPITAPAALAPELANDVLHRHDAKQFLPLLCLALGVTMESAEAALDAITRDLDEQDTYSLRRTKEGRRVTLLSASTSIPISLKVKPALIGFFLALMGLIITLDPVRDGYTPEKAQALFEKLPEILRGIGRVRSVAFADQPPISSEFEPTPMAAEDSSQSSTVLNPVVEETVGARYFATLSETLLAGREFDENDQRVQPSASKTLPAIHERERRTQTIRSRQRYRQARPG